jgi:NitT/TauT family transport system substrate-binding protein
VRVLACLCAAALLASAVAACGSSSDGSQSTGSSGTASKGLYDMKVLFGSPPNPAIAAELIPQALGWFKQGGLNVDFQYASGSNIVLNYQLAAQNKVDLAYGSPEPLIASTAHKKPLGVVYAYNMVRAPMWYVTVKKDSPIKGYADLKGKKVGVNSLGSPAVNFVQAGLRQAGLPDDAASMNTVNLGPAAMKALESGTVDALSTFDFDTATIDAQMNPATKLRLLPRPSLAKDMIGAGIFASPSFLKAHRRQAIAYFRAVTKGEIFTEENPEAAIKLMWKAVPQSKPAGMSDDQAMKMQLPILKMRAKSQSLSFKPGTKYGEYTDTEWKAMVASMGLTKQVTDVSGFYDDSMVAEVNDFDQGAIRTFAKNYKVS